jgi:hypothetical protein
MQAWTAATPPPSSPTTRSLAAAASRTSNGCTPGLQPEGEPKPDGKSRQIQQCILREGGARSSALRREPGEGGRRVRGLAARSGGWVGV